jgi:hypothetical protein
MYIGIHVKYPLFLSEFSETLILSIDFRTLKYQISWKSVQWERSSTRFSLRFTRNELHRWLCRHCNVPTNLSITPQYENSCKSVHLFYRCFVRAEGQMEVWQTVTRSPQSCTNVQKGINEHFALFSKSEMQLKPVPRLRMCGAIAPSPHMSTWCRALPVPV